MTYKSAKIPQRMRIRKCFEIEEELDRKKDDIYRQQQCMKEDSIRSFCN
jgi:hypothetical protein